MIERLKRILLVEDSPNDVALTLEALEAAHLANCVDVVRDGAEALDYLLRRGSFCNYETGSPAVVLLDFRLPKVDGLDVLHEIKADPALKLIPVVMLTSSREEPDLKRSYEHGANAYVVKPVEFHAFVDAVKEAGLFWAVVNAAPPS